MSLDEILYLRNRSFRLVNTLYNLLSIFGELDIILSKDEILGYKEDRWTRLMPNRLANVFGVIYKEHK
jgi:hypothetical protein